MREHIHYNIARIYDWVAIQLRWIYIRILQLYEDRLTLKMKRNLPLSGWNVYTEYKNIFTAEEAHSYAVDDKEIYNLNL